MELRGIPASPGYAIGKAFVLRPVDAAPSLGAGVSAEAECVRFHTARDASARRLASLREKAEREGRADEAEILDAHAELLTDDELEQDVAQRIRSGPAPAELAVCGALDAIIGEMGVLDAPYARERAHDFAALKAMLLRALTGDVEAPAGPLEPAIFVGGELTPADTAAVDKSLLLGIVSETGGMTSHVAIISRSLAIPAVVGVPQATSVIRAGDTVAVDGCAGRVLVNPSAAAIAETRARQASFAEELRLMDSLKDQPVVTRGGRAVRLCANIGSDAEVEAALRCGAEGIGLLRTEFLFLDRERMPGEEEQFHAYRQVAAAMNGKHVIVRTLDVGGDKPLPYLPLPHEANPFLGRRAIRLYGDWPELIGTQLRAILRASHYGAVHVMFPMIVSVDEVLRLRAMFEGAKDELRRAGRPFDPAMPVGIMIETPAAALIAERLIEHVDFFSIGANDLTQYTLAADRGNERLAALYDPLHPAVLRLIQMTLDAAHAAGKWAGICGEMASDESAAEKLLGMGIDELSMTPSRIPWVKRRLLLG